MTLLPKQWAKYIANPQNKLNLCEFVTTTMSHLGRENMAIGKVGERMVCITNATCEDLEELRSTMKRQTPDYSYTPSMPHNQAQGSSSSLLIRTFFVLHTLVLLPAMSCGLRPVSKITSVTYQFMAPVKN